MRTKAIIERAILRAAALLALPAALGACGVETPPYDDLPLRDALSAAPEVLATLPEQALHEMAARLEEAHGAGGDEAAVADAEIASVPALVRSADAAREDRGEDAIVLGALEPSADGFVLRSLAAERALGAPEGPLERPVLAGEPPSPSTARLEEAALGGRAGEILADIARRAGARDLVRVTGLPAGVIAQDRTVYVNASWLVALSALAPPDAPAPPGPPGGAVVISELPRIEPRSVRANPYHLPPSLAVCAAEVRQVCTCAAAGRCEHERTDPTFADAQAECAWVNAGELHAEALCVLALMSIEGVRECVLSAGNGACAALPIADRDGARAFAADQGCMAVLDLCLQHGRPTLPSGAWSGPSGGATDSGGCSCASCNNDIADCNQNCSDCNQNCSDCNQNQSDCDRDCKGSSCRLSAGPLARTGGRPDAPPPLGAVFWLLAPAGYMALRIRRRA
ncbi:hypothetical protein WMF31_29585 [Sorangium sp. So ce1036]|uniref:hypothetical protein n=1 Tax=Sorangium sp. So ce1036 TaxID=3133328 RepID=UPI003F0FE409